MNPEMFKCRGCGRQVPRDPRLGERQEYCSRRRCQLKRKARWQRRRMRTDVAYRLEQLAAQKLARSKRAAPGGERGAAGKPREEAEGDERPRVGRGASFPLANREVQVGASGVGKFGAGLYVLRPAGEAGASGAVEVFLIPADWDRGECAAMDSMAGVEAVLGAES